MLKEFLLLLLTLSIPVIVVLFTLLVDDWRDERKQCRR